MKLVKTTIFSAVITFVKISSGFVASKFVAIFTGPAGIALIGAFTNFISLSLTFANGAINNGVVKYTAEFEGDERKQKALFSTAFKISVCCSSFFGIILICFSSFFSEWILTNSLYTHFIRVLGFTIVLYSLNTLLISILNGKNQIKTYTLVNTTGSLISLFLTVILVYYLKIEGALYSLVLTQSIVFFVTAGLIIRSDWFKWTYFNQVFNKQLGKKLAGFSLMAIVTAITAPVSQIILRNLVIKDFSIESAGFWQATMRVSDGYLMLVTTALATYYLPKLSKLKKNNEIAVEIYNGYKLILPFIFLSCIIIYFSRFFIIDLLYTESFLPMENLFFWQLIGDFFKIAAWILSYLMLAKAMVKTYIITDLFFSSLYIALSMMFMHYFKLKGITIAFAVNYILYFLFMVVIFRNVLFTKMNYDR